MAVTPSTGSYACVDIQSVFGTAIRHLTRSKYDHAFVVLDASAGTILEAQPHGAVIDNIAKYAGLPMVFSDDAIINVPPADMLTRAKKYYQGTPYGFLDIAYLGLALSIGVHDDGWLLNKVLDTGRMICSQMVAAFGASYGVDWKCGQEYTQLVTPGMLAARVTG